MLEHGGALNAAAARFGIARADWLDLSTGINPQGWPLPPLPAEAWQRLPEPDDGLLDAAAGYYGTPHLLAVAGSQAALRALPRLRPRCRVGVLAQVYAEHAAAWHAAGHAVATLAGAAIEDALDRLDVLVLVNPANPSGETFAPERLHDWHARLAARGGWLVVDEAFIDATPAASLAPHAGPPGLVVLRSLGKFFGLAGARVGFVAAAPALCAALDAALGPWTVAGPARWVAARALADRAWQAATRQRLIADSARLAATLAAAGLPPAGGTALFQYLRHPRAAALAEALARRGVLVRRFAAPAALRFGLPPDAAGHVRLAAALAEALAASAEGA